MKAEIKTYEGSCHCGNVKFTIDLAIDGLLRCNCSICTKTGALWAFAPKADVNLLTDESAFGNYQFGAKRLTHHFCKTCGVETFTSGENPADGTPTVGINVRSFDEFDLKGYPIQDYDGASL